MQLKPYDIVLDTGANGSIVRNKNLLHDIHTKTSLTFNGIAGALVTKKAGALRDLGNAYYHHLSPANILSFSQVRDEGHAIHFERRDNTDMFVVTTPSFEYHFKDRGDGLYICDLTPIKTPCSNSPGQRITAHQEGSGSSTGCKGATRADGTPTRQQFQRRSLIR